MVLIGHSMTQKEKIRRILKKRGAKLYFIGIGGISMSSLALMCNMLGAQVSGSDVVETEITQRLQTNGIEIYYEQKRENIIRASSDMVIYSLSVSPDNEEYLMAKEQGILTVSRAELLSALILDYATAIAVSGSHGKSTTTAMISSALTASGLYPTTLCGAEISEHGGILLGRREYLVLEACEYGGSFLHFCPDVQIFLNLDLDHTDCYASIGELMDAFAKAGSNAKQLCIVNTDDENLSAIVPRINTRVVTFSKKAGSDYRYITYPREHGKYGFKLFFGDKPIGDYPLSVIGEFNAVNAAAAAVLADVLGIDALCATRGISEFRGIGRRLEKLKPVNGTDIFYDYAHHPREIVSVLDALRGAGYQRIGTVFSPHTYSRTAAFFDDFAKALSEFDTAIITDIYGAREARMAGVCAEALVDKINALGGRAFTSDVNNVINYINESKPDCFVLMGAGDLEKIKLKLSQE